MKSTKTKSDSRKNKFGNSKSNIVLCSTEYKKYNNMETTEQIDEIYNVLMKQRRIGKLAGWYALLLGIAVVVAFITIKFALHTQFFAIPDETGKLEISRDNYISGKLIVTVVLIGAFLLGSFIKGYLEPDDEHKIKATSDNLKKSFGLFGLTIIVTNHLFEKMTPYNSTAYYLGIELSMIMLIYTIMLADLALNAQFSFKVFAALMGLFVYISIINSENSTLYFFLGMSVVNILFGLLNLLNLEEHLEYFKIKNSNPFTLNKRR